MEPGGMDFTTVDGWDRVGEVLCRFSSPDPWMLGGWALYGRLHKSSLFNDEPWDARRVEAAIDTVAEKHPFVDRACEVAYWWQ